MAFRASLLSLAMQNAFFPRRNCRKAGISFGCLHLVGVGVMGRKGCGYSNAGPEAKNSFRLSTKCSFHRGESRGGQAYLEPLCQGQALEEEGDGGGRRGTEGEGGGGMKVIGVSEPDLDRRGAPSACGGCRESPHRYQAPIVPRPPRGPRTQLAAGQDRSPSIQA